MADLPGSADPSDTHTSIATLVEQGLDADANGDAFLAHERFEAAWRLSGTGAERSLELHALAQIAAAAHKVAVGGPVSAAAAILGRARAKLARVEASAFGIDLDRLRASIDACLAGGVREAPRIAQCSPTPRTTNDRSP